MYTLRRDEEGRLHGPIDKKALELFGSRESVLEETRANAMRRGFPPGIAWTIQMVIGGRTCLERGLRRLFQGAILTRDIRHVQEKLSEVGGLFHREGSLDSTCWVVKLEMPLSKGHVRALMRRLEMEPRGMGRRGPGMMERRRVLKKVITYLGIG